MTTPTFNRPPLNPGCLPPSAGPPSHVGDGDVCAVLPKLRAAYYALLSGQQSYQVRDGEKWQTWHRGDAKILQNEIRRLEAICNSYGPRYALRAGGINRRGFNPW